MKDLEDRALTRHRFCGGWNYTFLPLPRPAPPPPPAPPGPGPDTLAHPAITGMPRAAFDHLAASLKVPHDAAREQRLHLIRGAPRRRNSGPAGRVKLSLPAALLAALYRHRLGMTCQAIAALLAVDPSVISVATREIAALLPAGHTALTPGPHRIRTTGDLRQHAAAAGITISAPPAAAAISPDDTLTTHATP
jgi:hypothetical protein